MADTLVNTLYPPVLETFQPAFVYTDAAPVTFSLSPFNSADDIRYVHVSVVDQRNNENMLQEHIDYSTELGYGVFNGLLIAKLPTFNNTTGRATEGIFAYDANKDLYSISIPVSVLAQDERVTIEVTTVSDNTTDEDGNNVTTTSQQTTQFYQVGQYYKVQIRFDCTSVVDAATTNDQVVLANYMTDYRPYFSEWSEVTLIKPILPVELLLSKFDTDEESLELLSFNKGLIRIAGTVSFITPIESGVLAADDEHLQTYQLVVKESESQEVFYDSDKIYAQKNPDGRYGINYLIDMTNAEANTVYDLAVKIITNNGYEKTFEYQFTIADYYYGDFTEPVWNNRDYINHPTEEVNSRQDLVVNQEDGVVTIDFSCPNCKTPGTLYLKRASSIDNFKTWEIISITKHKGNSVAIQVVDYTVCSLHSYRYSAQYEYYGGLWSPIEYSNTVYIKFYEMLLERQNRQIAIRYSGQVSSWKPIVNRQKVDTLGGKYPKFVENAVLNYRQYSITGTISAEGDYNRKFLNENAGEWIQENEDSYEYSYKYQDDIQSYIDNFDNTGYMIRNDSAADGEYGYEENRVKDPAGNYMSARGNDYLDYGANRYATDETKQSILREIYTDDEYAASVFDDSGRSLLHQHDLSLYNNWYWEREFREQLVEWLNDGEPKLYRSMPEGNIPVILTDVNLTPLEQSRAHYQFSATLYEVGDGYSLEDLDRLGIIDIPKIEAAYIAGSDYTDNPDESDDSTGYGIIKVGQAYLPHVWGRNFIQGAGSNSVDWSSLTLIEQLNYQQGGYLSDYVVAPDSLNLTEVRIQFVTEPRWYKNIGSNSWELWDKDTYDEDLWLGYHFSLNGQQVFVSPRGYYEVPTDSSIHELTFEEGDEVVLDYVVSYNQRYSESSTPKRVRLYQSIVGQYSGMFSANEYIGDKIYQKYDMAEYNVDYTTGQKDYHHPSYVQSLQYWKGIRVDVSPYSLISVKYSDDIDTDYHTYLIGRTGVLDLLEDTPVKDIGFLGRKMFKVDKKRQPHLDEWEFVLANNDIDPPAPDENPTNWWEMVNGMLVKGPRVYITWDSGETLRDPDSTWREYSQSEDSPFAAIPNPQYNTVYNILIDGETKTYIYYIDGIWYPISLSDDGTALAAVPVYGVVDYRGDLVRSEY